MSGALVGWMPLGRSVPVSGGRHLTLDAGGIDDWVQSLDVVPVLMQHDPQRPVGWVNHARIRGDCLYLFGELDDSFDPHSRAAGHVIRSRVVQGLSPLVTRRAGERMYGTGRWGPGEVYSFPELSVVGNPRIPHARWEVPHRGGEYISRR